MRRIVAALTTSMALVFHSMSPATASPISGDRHWGDGNHHVLPSQVSSGNMVGLWQSFLVAYDTIPCSGVDGTFGIQSENATKGIQNFFSLTPDGIVGKQTWNAASHWLHTAGSDGFLTTYWTPNYASTFFPLYAYVYGGDWSWEVPMVTAPFEASFDTDHPAITFGSTC